MIIRECYREFQMIVILICVAKLRIGTKILTWEFKHDDIKMLKRRYSHVVNSWKSLIFRKYNLTIYARIRKEFNHAKLLSLKYEKKNIYIICTYIESALKSYSSKTPNKRCENKK